MRVVGRLAAIGALLALGCGGAMATEGTWHVQLVGAGSELGGAPALMVDHGNTTPSGVLEFGGGTPEFVAYCVDRYSDTGYVDWTATYSNAPTVDFATAAHIANNPGYEVKPWWTVAGQDTVNKWLQVSYAAWVGRGATSVGSDLATGVQAVIWHILNMGQPDDSGLSAGAKTVFETIERDIKSGTYLTNGAGQAYLLDRYYQGGTPMDGQGLVVAYDGTPGVQSLPPTPEASSLLLLLPGLLPLGLVLRKRSAA